MTIAFTSDRTGNGDIYSMMSTNGASQTRLTTSAGLDTGPAWSGTTIAFASNRQGDSNFEIFTMTQVGGSQTNVTNRAGQDISPAWSSDGTKIVFASNRAPAGGLNFDILTMNPNGSGQTPLVTHPAVELFPDW